MKKAFNRFHNHSFSNAEGKWASILEYNRWLFLKRMRDEGKISELQKQVRFEIIKKQTVIVEKQLKTKVKLVEKVLSLPTYYIADFVYQYDGQTIIEDTKGMKTPEYRIKAKLMLQLKRPISEVKKATAPLGYSTEIVSFLNKDLILQRLI